MLPQNLHFVWPGDEAPPDWAEANLRRFRLLNPFHSAFVWQNWSGLPRSPYRDRYGECVTVGQQSDLLRLAALEYMGGWYFDLDTIALSPADKMLPEPLGLRLFTPGFNGTDDLANACIAARRDAACWPFIREYVEAARDFEDATLFGTPLLRRLRADHPEMVLAGDPARFDPGRNVRDVYDRLERLCLVHGFRGGSFQKPVAGATGSGAVM